jgi:3'(2'), 5'-bisphosphate nucleotidase
MSTDPMPDDSRETTADRDDMHLARALATAAGRLLLDLRQELAAANERERGRAGDRVSQAYLASELSRLRPDDAILSEEALDDRARLSAERVWIIDPLDGTHEYSELGREDWAVHVALLAGGRLVAGAVALPALGVTLATDDVRLARRADGPPRIVVSRTRPPAFALRVRDQLRGELVAMGSAGAKVAAVVLGSADVYVHAGGQHEWDSAAPVAVARAAGLHASRIDGSPLEYNQPDPRLPDLVVSRVELAEVLLRAIDASAGR